MDKSLIILGGGILQLPLITQAVSMGFRPYVFDYNPKAPAFNLKCVEKVVCSTFDIEKAVKQAKKIARTASVRGVLTSGTDASLTVSSIAEALGLPAVSYEKAKITTNKIALREKLQEKGVNQTEFKVVTNQKEFENITGKIFEHKAFTQGAVIKPSSSMGARGVIYISEETLKNHDIYQEAFQYSKDSKVLIEGFMDAYELSIDSLIWNGKINITGTAIRYIQKPPYFVEHGHLMPADINSDLIEAGIDAFIKGINAIELDIGAAKGDIFVRYEDDPVTGEKKPKGYVSEIASRLSGGFMSTHTYPYSSGVNLMENIIKIHTGEEPDRLKPKWNIYSLEMGILPEKNGILKGIEGMLEAKAVPCIKDVFLYRNIGEKIQIPVNNVTKAGSIIGAHSDKEYLKQCVHDALNELKLIVE